MDVARPDPTVQVVNLLIVLTFLSGAGRVSKGALAKWLSKTAPKAQQFGGKKDWRFIGPQQAFTSLAPPVLDDADESDETWAYKQAVDELCAALLRTAFCFLVFACAAEDGQSQL